MGYSDVSEVGAGGAGLIPESTAQYFVLCSNFGIQVEAYRERKLTTAQLRRLMGFQSRNELDGFLKQHEVWLEYTWQDLEHDRETHRQLGL